MQVIPKKLNGIYVVKGATTFNLISDLLWLPTYYPTWDITIMYDNDVSLKEVFIAFNAKENTPKGK